MAYFYVKNSLGTRVAGGGTTIQTGTFATLGAANVYATIALAITDGATSGDIICVSDAHSFSAGAVIVTHAGPSTGDFLQIVSVDDANCDTYAKATAFQEYSTTRMDLADRISYKGLWFKSDDDFRMGAQVSQILFDDGILEVTGSGDKVIVSFVNDTYLRMTNSEFRGVAGSIVEVTRGMKLDMFGGSITGITDLRLPAVSGGSSMRLVGVDLSDLSGFLVHAGGGSPASDAVMNVSVEGCVLHATTTFVDETLTNPRHRVKVTNSSSVSAEAEYQFHSSTYGGEVNEIDTIYRNGSTAFPSGQKISLKCVTLATANPAIPFWFDFPTRYAELSNAASDTLRIYIVSSTTLTDADVWSEAVYPDGTTKQIYNLITNRDTNILTAGTTLTTNSETWTSPPATPNYYQIDLDTSADAGADGIPVIRLYVAKASATIYFCPTLGLS